MRGKGEDYHNHAERDNGRQPGYIAARSHGLASLNEVARRGRLLEHFSPRSHGWASLN